MGSAIHMARLCLSSLSQQCCCTYSLFKRTFLWLLDTLVKTFSWLISCISWLTLSHLKTYSIGPLCSLTPALGHSGYHVRRIGAWWEFLSSDGGKSSECVPRYLVSGLVLVRKRYWPKQLHKVYPQQEGFTAQKGERTPDSGWGPAKT